MCRFKPKISEPEYWSHLRRSMPADFAIVPLAQPVELRARRSPKWCGALLVYITAMSCIAHPAFAADAGVAQLTKEDMLASVEASRSRISDLSVVYTFDAVGKAPPEYFGAREHIKAVVKGSKSYILIGGGQSLENGGARIAREVAYNGKESTIHVQISGRALVRTRKERETQTQGLGFFDMNMLNAPKPDSAGFDDQSLVSLLSYAGSQVRGILEQVDGRACYVIDALDRSNKRKAMTAWLDCERGFMPVRQVFYAGADSVLMEFFVDHAIEVKPGLWFAVHGRKRIHPVPGARQELQSELEHVLEVRGWREGHPSISLNAGIPDEFFDLWKRLPPGTLVDNYDTKKRWTVGGTDFKGVGESAQRTFDGAPLPIPERSSRQAGSATGDSGASSGGSVGMGEMPDSGFRTWITILGFGAAACALILLVVRAIRRNRTA